MKRHRAKDVLNRAYAGGNAYTYYDNECYRRLNDANFYKNQQP